LKTLPEFREELNKGDFMQLRIMFKQDSKTLAELLQEPDLFKEMMAKVEGAKEKLSALLFLFTVQSVLTEQQKRIAKATLVRLLIELASQISAKGIRSTERFLTTYRPGLEEISVEETLENICSKRAIEYEDIVMVDRRHKKRWVVLILDTSNSMQREKIVIAVLAIGVLAYRLQGEHYGIISFNTEAKVLKDIEKEVPIEELLNKLLEIKPENATDIKKGLEKGLEQLSKNVAHEKIAILVTDGWVTAGGDPVEVAAKFPRVHVIQAPIGLGGGDEEMCKRIAKAGKGKWTIVKRFEELPRAILKILS
jgi:hypothetical protein